MLSLNALVFSLKLKRQFSREIGCVVETEVPRLANESKAYSAFFQGESTNLYYPNFGIYRRMNRVIAGGVADDPVIENIISLFRWPRRRDDEAIHQFQRSSRHSRKK